MMEKAKMLAENGERVTFIVASQDYWEDMPLSVIEQSAKQAVIEQKSQFPEEYFNTSTDDLVQDLINVLVDRDQRRSKTKLEAGDHFLFSDVKRRLSGFKNISVEFVHLSQVGPRVNQLMLEGSHVLIDEFGTFFLRDFSSKWFTVEHVPEVCCLVCENENS